MNPARASMKVALALSIAAAALPACSASGEPANGATSADEGAVGSTSSADAVEAENESDRGDAPGLGHLWPFVLPAFVPVAGKSQRRWSEEWWRWILSVPAAHNPELVLEQDCAVGQSGPVYFVPGFQADVYTRTCRVPLGKFVFLPAWSYLNDYPCPDPTFQPPPGQTLEDWLAEGARAFNDKVTNLTVQVDGRAVGYQRRRQTTRLFSFTGDISLKPTFDGCITGTPQSAVSDGWWLMLAPLLPGDHTIVLEATSPSGHATSATIVLHVGS
jgi:hypothetical protein